MLAKTKTNNERQRDSSHLEKYRAQEFDKVDTKSWHPGLYALSLTATSTAAVTPL